MKFRVVLATVWLAATAVAHGDTAPSLADFTNVTGGQYQVLAQSGSAIGVQVNRFMNQMLQQYTRFFSNWSSKAAARVIVFSNATDFQNYAAEAARQTHTGLAGYCHLVTDADGNSYYELVTYEQDNLWRILAHEGFHQFLGYELGLHPPVWLNEGMAQYFETSQVVHGRFSTGEISRNKLAAAQHLIRSGRAPAITTLTALAPSAFYENAQITYPTSWALVDYLLQRDEKSFHDSAVRRYFSDLKLGKDPTRSFGARFGHNSAELQADFEQFILRLEARVE